MAGPYYDRSRLRPTAERTLIQRCTQRSGSSGLIGIPDQCRGQSDRRFTFSDDPRLLDLAGWQQYVGRRGEREQHNRQICPQPGYRTRPAAPRNSSRSTWSISSSTRATPVAVPALLPLLQGAFRLGTGGQWTTCSNTFAFLNAGNDFAKTPLGQVDPERVYAVDYLLAEANQNWVSRWGHSMLRLVICAAGRPRGPDCRLDLDQHLVLSYRAFVGDVQLSSWDGLVGKYPSRLFVLPLAQVIDEYTKTELRSLASVPLNLSRDEIENVVERTPPRCTGACTTATTSSCRTTARWKS